MYIRNVYRHGTGHVQMGTGIDSFPLATEQHHWHKYFNCKRGWCIKCFLLIKYVDGLIGLVCQSIIRNYG